MERDDKQAVFGCAVAFLVVAGVIASLYVWYTIQFNRRQIEIDGFYQSRSVLRDMREATLQSNDPSSAAQQALLTRFPVGTDRERVVEALGQDGFKCEQADRNRRRRPGQISVECYLAAPAQTSYTSWQVQLLFNLDNRLEEVIVMTYTI